MNEYIEVNGKIVGYIDGDSYFTRRFSKKHFFRKQQGYPISVAVLSKLKNNGVKYIVIIEINKKLHETWYRCFVSDFDNIVPFKEEEYDLQKCIPLRRWEKIYYKCY